MSRAAIVLGDLADVVSGFAFKSKDFVESGIPVIKIANIKHEYVSLHDAQCLPQSFLEIDKKYHVSNGDLLISLTGSHLSQPNSVVGRIARYRLENSALLNQRAGKIIIKNPEMLDTDFLYYFLRQPKVMHELALNAGGAANQANISPRDVERTKLPDISLGRQKAIANVLCAYDDLIEKNRRRIALLEEAARQLYREWFVRFRFPGHEHVKIVDGIPAGWQQTNLFDKATATYGYAFKLKLFSQSREGLPVVHIRDVPKRVSRTFTQEDASEDKLLADGDFLIGMDGDFHMNYWCGGPAWLNQRVVRIMGQNGVSTGFLKQALEKPIRDLNKTITGTTVRHLGAKHLKAINLLVPPSSLLEQTNDFLEHIRSQVVLLFQQITKLTEARDLLLPKLINGELAA